MEKTVYITEKEREMCYKVIGAFAELYEMEDEDILVVDVGRYGFVKLQCYTPSYGFEELTPTLLREFVEKIVVHECSYDENKTRRQDIEIYYSFVGKVDLPE